MNAILQTARAVVAARIVALPVANDGSKKPDVGPWKTYRTTPPSKADYRNFDFAAHDGLGIIAGAVSDCRESWDFDTAEIVTAFIDAAEACGLGALVARIRAGYEDETPGGGRRWIVTYPDTVTWHDCTLAKRPKRPEEKQHDKDAWKTLIELPTFAIIAPSNGRTHPSGRPYVRIAGGFDTIAVYSIDERQALIDLARSFDQMPTRDYEPAARSHTAADRPGDDFNRRASWSELLPDWTTVYERSGTIYLRRPGKNSGWSATINARGTDRLHVFSTSTIFDADTSYSKFGAYAVLHHGGDFSKAALALVKDGYGADSRVVEGNPSDWPVPAAIQSALPPVRAFSEDLLPESFRPLIRDVAERMQVPMDYPAVAIALCLAGVVNRRAVIQPKARDTDWQVIPNLWGGIVGPPGFMKTPVIQAATHTVNQIQSEWRCQDETAANDYARRKEEYELRLAAWRELYKSKAKKESR